MLELCLSENTTNLLNIQPHLNVIRDLTLSCEQEVGFSGTVSLCVHFMFFQTSKNVFTKEFSTNEEIRLASSSLLKALSF